MTIKFKNKLNLISVFCLVWFIVLLSVPNLTTLTTQHKIDPNKENIYVKSGATLTYSKSTWISGNDTINQWGEYGSKGVPDAANYPGARQYSVSWTDSDGNLWLFGGYGLATSGGLGYLNDLWRINISSSEWTWISGNETTNRYGEYGIKGVPDVANYPGSRQSSVSWTDIEGNLWLFGGVGYNGSNFGYLNDLWRFNISSSEWTWISGNETINNFGIYGTKGEPDAANYPGARQHSVSWTDLDGDLWLSGGYGYGDYAAASRLNDLWRFDISSSVWTWISGNETLGVYGEYGEKGVPDIANYPGSRRYSVSWTDLDGNLWLFGGEGNGDFPSIGRLNDLWRFNISSSEWTWISGNETANCYSVYGTIGVPDAANYPGARESSVSWIDAEGDFWLFGGWGYNESNNGYLNDLWRFDLSSSEWTWESGDKNLNVFSKYGTKGVPDAANYPGSRMESISWTDTEGNLWLFGGVGYATKNPSGSLNDLWKLSLSTGTTSPGGGSSSSSSSSSSSDDNDDDDENGIPGYNFLVMGIFSGATVIVLVRVVKNRKKKY